MPQKITLSHLKEDHRQLVAVLEDLEKGEPAHLSDDERVILAKQVEVRLKQLEREIGQRADAERA